MLLIMTDLAQTFEFLDQRFRVVLCCMGLLSSLSGLFRSNFAKACLQEPGSIRPRRPSQVETEYDYHPFVVP